MPDIPSYQRQITVKPVGKAPLPVSAAGVGAGAIGAGLQQLGQGIGDIGNILFQIKREQLALSDAINETKANAFIKSERNDFATVTSGTDPGIKEQGPSNWETSSAKSMDALRKNIAGLSFSGRARKLMEAKLEALSVIRASEIRTAQSNALVKQAKAYLPLNVKNAVASGNTTLIADAMGTFEANKARVWGTDEIGAADALRKAIRDGMMEQAAANPELMASSVEAEQKARKKGKKAIEAFALLSNTDLEDIRDYANTVGDKIETDSKLAANQAVEDAYAKIRKGDVDIISMIAAIQANPVILADDSNIAVNAVVTFFNKRNTILTKPTDPKVRWDTLRKLQKDPRTVTDDYLEGLIGKGLTFDDTEEFKKIRDSETDPLKMPRAQLYFNRLDALFEDRDTDADEAYEWDIANDKLTDFFKRKPDATAKEVKEFYEELTEGKKRNWLDRLLNPLSWESGTAASRLYEWRKGKKKEPEAFKYTAINPQTGERMGSNDGVKWQPIKGKGSVFDPEGTGYDDETAGKAGLRPNEAGHWGSLDPRTGMVLKGRKHPTWDLMVKEEERLGNKIVKKGKRYYSVEK